MTEKHSYWERLSMQVGGKAIIVDQRPWVGDDAFKRVCSCAGCKAWRRTQGIDEPGER